MDGLFWTPPSGNGSTLDGIVINKSSAVICNLTIIKDKKKIRL